MSILKLNANQLIRHTDPSTLPQDTRTAPKFDSTFAQTRAVRALTTALDIKANGYHVFAVGENGLGKRTLITNLLKQRAKTEPTPDDLVYVHNFDNPRNPIALKLPPSTAPKFAEDIAKLWRACQKKLTQKFNSLNYQNQLGAIKQALQNQESQLIDEFNAEAKQHNLRLSLHPTNALWEEGDKKGVFGVIDSTLPVDVATKSRLQPKLLALNHKLDEIEDDSNQAIDELHDNLAKKVLEPLFRPLFKKYSDPAITRYLEQSFDDMTTNAVRIVDNDDDFLMLSLDDVPARYGVNVLISHAKNSGSPIVFEDLPTHLNLLGHIEYLTQLGTAYSDVSMIRAGALHRANGGYLLLEAQSLLEHPYAWQGLKRALQSKQIKISSLEQMLTLTGSLSLEPMAVELSVKVILLGEPDLYYELLEFEPEFNAVFKIRADFADSTPRDLDSETALVAKIADMVHTHQLRPFDNTACAKILEMLSRFADSQNKLDLHSDRLMQLLLESNRYGNLDNSPIINASHVSDAINEMIYRTSFLKELYWQEIQNGQQLISTHGKAVGQINALTVISYADSEFGLPARLTAVIAPRFGNGEILDIERDVELGGSLHAKGMLIMTSFLRSLFSEFYELNFSASLAFEQSYGHIDGDSATLAECCALLSALADVPIAQNLAITGSMNQLGQAQAIGGVNAKIAGFFDTCVDKGLDGTQGVILPRANLEQLMLRDDIIHAVKQGQFTIYAIDDIYDALSLLSQLPINDKNKNGEFKKQTLFGKITKRLSHWENQDKQDDKSTHKKG